MYKVSDNVIIWLWERCNWIAGSEWEEENAAGPFVVLVKRYKEWWFKCIVDVPKETIRRVCEVITSSQESLVLCVWTITISPHGKKNIKLTSWDVKYWQTLSVFLWLVLVFNIVYFILQCLVNVFKEFTVNLVCYYFGFILCFTCSPFVSSKVQRKCLQCTVWGKHCWCNKKGGLNKSTGYFTMLLCYVHKTSYHMSVWKIDPTCFVSYIFLKESSLFRYPV